MTYMRVKWTHTLENEPILLYSEIDENRWELRKVEVYANGRMSYANKYESVGGSGLSKEPLPLLKEIATDPQFEPVEISEMDFQRVWAKAHELSDEF